MKKIILDTLAPKGKFEQKRVASFTAFWVVTDVLGQWISGRGILKSQILWSIPLGMMNAGVTKIGYILINLIVL